MSRRIEVEMSTKDFARLQSAAMALSEIDSEKLRSLADSASKAANPEVVRDLRRWADLVDDLCGRGVPDRAWSTLEPARFSPDDEENERITKATGSDEVYQNDLYQVTLRWCWLKGHALGEDGRCEHCGLTEAQSEYCKSKDLAMVQLSIKRLDKSHMMDWRHMQRIKNELCGPEREAVELFPAESRLVDTANQFHMWVGPAGFRFPFGYSERLIMEGSDFGTRQRPFEDPELKAEANESRRRLLSGELDGHDSVRMMRADWKSGTLKQE